MATNLKESYDLLGLPTDATEEEVRKAYIKKAKECHPDKNPDDPQATEKFQALSEGYERINSNSRTESTDEENFSGCDDFFNFIFFREMMRRRMREEMIMRMFGGIFDDDIGLEGVHFPFGGPLFNRPRSHESFARWHHSRFQDERAPSAHDTSTKSSKKEKQRKKNPRNASDLGPSGDLHEREYSRRRNFSNEATTSDRGETINSKSSEESFPASNEKEASDKKRDKQHDARKSKQKNKNKGQMTAAEWQKGRKKNHKKKTARS